MAMLVVENGVVVASSQMPNIISWFARPSRLYLSDGVTLDTLEHREYTKQTVPADGHRFQMFFICDGTEDILSIGYLGDTDCGRFQLYVNGILTDATNYNTYQAAPAYITASFTLSGFSPAVHIKKGRNLIELRVNGKDIASSGYALKIFGATIH